MSMTDPLGDMLTRIRNGQRAHKDTISTPASHLRANVLDVLKREGYIRDYIRRDVRPCLECPMPLIIRKPVTLAAVLAVSLTAPLAPVQAAPVTVPTATGEAQIETTPDTVAVFDIAAVDTISALGVEIAGVPNSLYLNRLNDVAQNATVVGTLFEPDFEALANLNPDLIIAGGRSSAQVEALSRLAPTLDMTITPDGYVDQIRARTTAYGEIFGKQAEGRGLQAELLGLLGVDSRHRVVVPLPR